MKEQIKKGGNQGPVLYGMGFLGSLVYFITHATGFWMGVLGIVKAIFWPAFVIYKVLELLKL
jgi:hypothetical protein